MGEHPDGCDCEMCMEGDPLFGFGEEERDHRYARIERELGERAERAETALRTLVVEGQAHAALPQSSVANDE